MQIFQNAPETSCSKLHDEFTHSTELHFFTIFMTLYGWGEFPCQWVWPSNLL